MSAENAFALATDSLNRLLGAVVSRVGMQANAEHTPYFKGVREHKKFRFGVCCCTNGGSSKPGVTDFAAIGEIASVAGMSQRPRPEFDVPEARGADDGSVAGANDRKRQGVTRIVPAKRGGNVVG